MPRIQHTIHVNSPVATVFDVTNDIDRWSELFDAYSSARVIRREDAGRFSKLTFRLQDQAGSAWQSWRILDHEELVAIAEREWPLSPFSYMHLRWTYVPQAGGTQMTWIQDFEVDPSHTVPEAVMVQRMDAHGRSNQLRIKRYLESAHPATGSRP